MMSIITTNRTNTKEYNKLKLYYVVTVTCTCICKIDNSEGLEQADLIMSHIYLYIKFRFKILRARFSDP